MKKVLVLILALLMVLPILAACSPAGNGGDTTTTEPSGTTTAAPGGTQAPGTTTTTEAPTATTTEAPVAAEIPEGAYYSGVTFNVLSRTGDTGVSWGNYEIIYNEESELVVTEISNAVKSRNEALYEKLGVDVEQVKGGYTEAQTALQTNTHEYDMVIVPVEDALKLAQTGKLYATSELEYMDTSKSWYDQNALNDLKIKGKNYYFFSDITCVEEDATWLFYFNHDIIVARDLENPYDLLANDQWTLDKLLSMAEAATDSTTEANKEAAWGIAGHQDLIGSLYNGSGEKIAIAEGNNFKLTINSDRLVDVMEKAMKIRPYWARYDISNLSTSGDYVLDRNADNYSGLLEMYAAGNVLFMAEVLAASRDLSALETEIHVGILPCPMYDDQQTRYYTPINDIAGITCLPKTDPTNAERTSVIVEYWAYESSKTLLPAYYDQAQKSRFAKDDITPDVLDAIFEARSYDIGMMYNWNNLYGRLTALMFDGNTDFSSMYNKYANSTNILIKNALKKFPD